MGVDVKPPVVEVGEPGASGMAHVTVALMEGAVAKSPELARKMRGSFALWTTDYRTGVTVYFKGDRLVVDGVRADDAWLVIEGEALVLGRLGSGDHDINALRSGKVRVPWGGLLRHPIFALRLRKLLAGDPASPDR